MRFAKSLLAVAALGALTVTAVEVGGSPAGASASQCAICVSAPETLYIIDGGGDDSVRGYVGVAIPVRVNKSLLGRVTVPYRTVDGTASAPADFMAVTDGRVSIEAGATVGYALVYVKRTVLCEAGKAFGVAFGAPSTGRMLTPQTRLQLRAPSCPS
jgi:Calx-beta domain